MKDNLNENIGFFVAKCLTKKKYADKKRKKQAKFFFVLAHFAPLQCCFADLATLVEMGNGEMMPYRPTAKK